MDIDANDTAKDTDDDVPTRAGSDRARATPAPSPRVSVIIPTFNRMEMLAETIATVEAQSHPNIEIIVIDDGSTDGTRTRFGHLSHIIYLHQENAGPSAARNRGIRRATGKYLAFLDSDDRWQPEFLTECVRELESSEAGFTFANWNVIDENDAITTENVFVRARRAYDAAGRLDGPLASSVVL